MPLNIIRVFLTCNDGAGFSEEVDVPAGYTVSQIYKNKFNATADSGKYIIRLNGENAALDKELSNGDRLSFTPKKVEGA